jgi:hypothetical protein
MSKKIKVMEYLVDVALDNLNEQEMFNPSRETARVKGEANVSWTGCADRRCDKAKDKFEMGLCREQCKRDAASEALSRVRGLTGYCNKSKNPRSCVKSLRRTADAWSNRISRIDDRIADIKRDRDKFKTQASGR